MGSRSACLPAQQNAEPQSESFTAGVHPKSTYKTLTPRQQRSQEAYGGVARKISWKFVFEYADELGSSASIDMHRLCMTAEKRTGAHLSPNYWKKKTSGRSQSGDRSDEREKRRGLREGGEMRLYARPWPASMHRKTARTLACQGALYLCEN